MLISTVNRYSSQFDCALLVLRAGECELGDQVRQTIAPDLHILYSYNAKEGMGGSLRDGAHYLAQQTPEWGLVWIALGDMPFVMPETLTQLYQESLRYLKEDDQSIILVPVYRGVSGHPVGFSRHFLPELQSAQKDSGARFLLKRHADRMKYLPVSDPGIIADVDEPKDLLN